MRWPKSCRVVTLAAAVLAAALFRWRGGVSARPAR
jgi:hypothetical protein